MPAQTSGNESARIAALRRYRIMDTVPEQSHNDIAELACLICNAPIGAVSFVDQDRQWLKSCIGPLPSGIERKVSFCSQAIQGNGDLLEIPDALADERFRENPLVTGDPFVRFYAGSPIVDSAGHQLGAVCVIDTVPRQLSAPQKAGLAALARQVAVLLEARTVVSEFVEKDRFKHFLENSPVVAFLKEPDGPIHYVNRTFSRLFSEDPAGVLGKSYADLWPADFAARMAQHDRDVVQSNRPVVCEYVAGNHGCAQQFWHLYLFPIDDGSTPMIGGIAIDATDDQRNRQHLESEIDRLGVLSNTDSLTGIGNRRALDDRLAAELDFCKRHGQPLSFLMVDIDRFKHFNDRFGHLAGDRLLASIAQTLVENSRRHDVVARYGGEEFGVILRNTNLRNAAIQAERLRAAVERMPPKDITISIGVAQFDTADHDAVRMVTAADAALYEAKNLGRNRVGVAAPDSAGTMLPARRKRSGMSGPG